MAVRTWAGLAAIATLAAFLHGRSISQSVLPAQDGLRFLRAARAFSTEGPIAAIRGTDQHPLYPAMIALVWPPVSLVAGQGPVSWRLAAQLVSSIASVATLAPLFLLARRLHGEAAGLLAAFLFTLLPVPMEIGHDTLSDPLALLLTLVAFERGSKWLEEGSPRAALGCGLASGLGYWARPEVALVALVIGLVGLARHVREGRRGAVSRRWGPAFALLPLFALVGGYGVVKGRVSEKLSFRLGIGLPPAAAPRDAAAADHPIIPPKEEAEPRPLSFAAAAVELAATWLRVAGVLITPLVLAGACLAPPSPTRTALRLYLIVFGALLLRHLVGLGYLSMRHVLAPVVLGLPWAGWRLGRLLSRLGSWLRLGGRARLAGASLAVLAMLAGGLAAQAKPSHPSRRPHWEAGRWLAREAGPDSAVLDTRGWAAFVADRPFYGPWHFRQAEADPRLAFVVVERDELDSGSERAHRLAEWLDGRATLAAEFAGRDAGAVRVYRWHGTRAGGGGS